MLEFSPLPSYDRTSPSAATGHEWEKGQAMTFIMPEHDGV